MTTATLVRVKATLRTALNAAIRAGHITNNAASRAELLTARRPKTVVWTMERVKEWQRTGIRPPVAVWTPAQTAAFLNAIQGHRLYAAYHLIALRGLRRGEAVGRDCLDSGYVFTRLNGDPMAPDWLSRYFRQLNDASGLRANMEQT